MTEPIKLKFIKPFEMSLPVWELEVEENTALLTPLYQSYHAQANTPRVGEWVRHPDGKLERIGMIGDQEGNRCHLQISLSADASFFFQGPKCCEYSGSFEPGSSGIYTLGATEETCPALVWIFRKDKRQAHNSIYATVPLKVWEVC